MKNTIFVQIASYRDPELVNTLDSLFDNAKYPDNLRVGLIWQREEDETLGKYSNDSRLRILEVPYQEAKGACWARNLVQYLYRGEKYTLQLDSHHRFIKNWDSVLIKMLKDLQKKGHKKPLITSYLPHYSPSDGSKIEVPWRLVFDRFFPEGPAFPIPESIDNFKELKEPVPARFYSAHFAFTVGEFVKEVPHDPEMYFHGEEPSIGIRAFTHGYDLFHPHKVVGWHEYTREGKPKHWDDHRTWVDRNSRSYERYRELFSIDTHQYYPEEFGRFGLGEERTLHDYITYSGVDVTNKRVQQYTLNKKYPPNPVLETEEDYELSFSSFHKYEINISTYEVDINDDFDFWAITFKDERYNDIIRLDADENEIRRLIEGRQDRWIKIWRQWESSTIPRYYTIWTHSRNNGWGTPITRPL